MGQTSTKRKDAANSPMYKPFTLKYELECKKTGAERSLCLCKAGKALRCQQGEEKGELS